MTESEEYKDMKKEYDGFKSEYDGMKDEVSTKIANSPKKAV